jgi:hypothetical protein
VSSENLERLAKAGQLKAEPPSRKELEQLVRLGRLRLDGARRSDLAVELRFDLGYSGRVLALCHERRNAAEYGRDVNIDSTLVEDLLKATQAVLVKVTALKPPK